jgi:hypothetical protein
MAHRGDRVGIRESPEQGVLFDGRTAENFKLSSGTWVHTRSGRTTTST